jgi:hypothetical protein
MNRSRGDRHFGPDACAILYPTHTRPYAFRYTCLIPFSFLILIACHVTLNS